jgi:hypothetical protein
MLQHELHVLIREAQEQQTHCSFYLLLNLLLIEVLKVSINLVNRDSREVYLWTFGHFLF